MTNTTPISLCSVDECERPSHARGYCAPHYSTWHRSQKKYSIECKACGKKVKVSRSTATTCSRKCAAVVGTNAASAEFARRRGDDPRVTEHPCLVCGVAFPAKAGGKYCSIDCRGFASRSPLRRAIGESDSRSVISAIRKDSEVNTAGCWEWKRSLRDGYPIVRVNRKSLFVHRLALEAKHGKPLGSQAAHHVCANSKCVNPEHLQPVTHAENNAEMMARAAYVDRIRELESALAEIAPSHPILNRVAII